MSVKLHEIMSAAHARSASLAAEVAGYLVLGAADQIAGAPRSLGYADVSLSEEGQIRIAGGTPVDELGAERTLREILAAMLLESSSVTPGLLRAAHKPSAAGVDALIREIEVALVPVNRAAARRALARLHRDVERARSAGRLAEWRPPAPPEQAPPPPAPVRAAEPVLPAPVPKKIRVEEPSPSPAELALSVDLSSVLAQPTQSPPVAEGERSWLTPDSVAVVDVEWPEQPPAMAEEELLTVIPIYVEELAEEEAAPAPVVPAVPDLEVPPSPELPKVVRLTEAPEPVTVPQPLVAPVAPEPLAVMEAREASSARTPVHGSSMRVLEPEPFAVLEVSEPTPGVPHLAGDDATERMPPVGEPDEVAVERALEEVALAFVEPPEAVVGLETLDPPATAAAPVAVASPASEPAPAVVEVLASEPAPAVVELLASEPTPAVVEVLASEPPAAVVEVLASEPALAVVEAVASEPAPAAVEVPASEPAPAVVELLASEPALAVVEVLASEPAPAVVEAAASEPAPAVVEVLASEPAPAVVEAAASEPALAVVEAAASEEAAEAAEAQPAVMEPEPEIPELELAPSPPPPSPKEALERLATLPARPARHELAPPRYAPRKSDVTDLLAGFGVAHLKSERELCSDLKALAGLEQTAPPPVVELSETPPPVAVCEIGDVRAESPRASEGPSARVVAGAASVALVVAGIGLGSIPTRDQDAVGAAPASVPLAEAAEPTPPPCSAELTVRQVPSQARARVRAGADGSVVAPSRVVGSDAVFEGLACGQSAEVTVELPGRARWVRIPVQADALSPSAEAQSLVRYTVALR